MKKRTLSTFIAAALAATLMVGCGTSSNSTATKPVSAEKTASAAEKSSSAASGKPLKTIYLCNGNLGDKGFNDSAAEGMKMLKDKMGADVKVVEMGTDETSYESNYLDAVDQGYDLIVSGTWSVKELAQNIAAKNPKQNFLLFDCNVDRDVVKEGNMMGISYESSQSAYLTGVLAAKMLESGDAKIDSSRKLLGFVGSMDTGVINDFLVGYIQGVQSVDPKIKIMTSYVGAYEDVSKCMEMTASLYSQGAQIVYAPASQSILGAATAAKKADKYLIACDQDLYTELKESKPDIAKYVLTSSVKNVGDSIYAAVEGWKKGTMTLDQDYALGLESGAVGLAKNENYKSIVSSDVQKLIDVTEKSIINGDIKVKSAFDMKTDEISKMRDDMKP